MSLAPVLLEVEKAVESLIEGGHCEQSRLQSTFARAREFVLESQGLFYEVEQTLLTDGEGAQKLELAGQELSHSRDCLDRLEEASLAGRSMVLKERLEAFLGSARRCRDQFQEFAHLASQQEIYSPIPAFDAFIKAGIKVLNGQLDPLLLHQRSVALLSDLGRLERLVGLLPLVHTVEPELRSALESGLNGLQSGFGALGTYFENFEKPVVEDALRLFGSSTTILTDQLQRAESAVSENQKFTSFRPLEEWLRLREVNPDVPLDWIVGTVSDFFRSWDFLLIRGEELVWHPLLVGVEVEGGLVPNSWPSHKQLRESIGRNYAEVAPEGWMSTPDQGWASLIAPLENLQSQVMASQMAFEKQMSPFSELPGLERIASLKEEVKAGKAEASLLAAEFEQQLTKVEELLNTVRHANDPISREFAELLPIHRGAFIGMRENLEAGDWEGLEGRWQGVLTTLPDLAMLSRAVKMRLASESSESRQINCLRCGESNTPERRVCSSCGANLPAVVQKAQQMAEVGFAEEGGSPAQQGMSSRAIGMLDFLVEGLEANSLTREQAGVTLTSLIVEVDANRKVFASKVLPLMGKDPTLDAYLRLFAQVMGSYFGGLMQMNEFCEGGTVAQLHSGLATAREALESLESMKSIIDEALAG